MAVTFVIGRAGSGKTARQFRRVADAARADPLGPPVFWLLPKQATFTAERELTAALGAFSRVRVVSFDLLGRIVAADCGGIAVPEVTGAGRQMILGHLLRRHGRRLEYFAPVARRPGLAAELDATFAEFERSGKTTADLADLLDQLKHADPTDAQGPALQAKLRDLILLYDAYAAYLGQERLDPHRRLQQVRERLEQCALLRDAAVYVDGFADFTDYERRLLVGLGKACRSVEIALLLDPRSPTVLDPHHLPDDLSLFHRTEQAYRKLLFALTEEHVKLAAPVRLEGGRRFARPELAAVERGLFAPAPSAAAAGGGEAVVLFEAPDPRAEVAIAAREIQDLLRRGYRLRDVAVLVRDLGCYHALIDATFREHGLSYFVDRRRTAAHHPLLQFIRAAFQIARGGWPYPAVITFLKSGLAGVSLPEADAVENYLLLHRLRGAAWDDPGEWAFRDATGDDEAGDATPPAGLDSRDLDVIRRQVVERLRPLTDVMRSPKSLTVRDLAGGVFGTLEQFGVRQTLARWMDDAAAAGDLELRGEHGQVWAGVVELFDQMVDLLGGEPATPAEFADVLDAGLEQFDLALTPPAVDQILVGQVDRTRTPAVRAAIVLGLSEGSFPPAARDTSLLSHGERRELRRRQVELDADPVRRQLDERLLAYIAFTRASERLVVTRPLAGERGKPAEASPFWAELRRVVPAAVPVRVPREDGRGVGHVATPRQLLTCLMRWARTPQDDAAATSPAADARPALYQWLAAVPPGGGGGGALAALRDRAWPALGYANQAALSPDVARRLFPGPLRTTAGRLEAHAACPFRHFVKYGLGLAGRESKDVTALDVSGVFHDVLESLVADLAAAGREWKDLPPAEAAHLIRRYAAVVAEDLRGRLLLSTARNQYLLGRIERTLAQVVAAVRQMLSRGTFRPTHAGVKFGDGGRLPAYRIGTPGGGEVYVSGRIDRIDVAAGDGAAVVFDYRLGAESLSVGDLYHGLSLGLLTSLLVLETGAETLAGRPLVPAAAFYFQLLRGLQQVAHPDEAADPASPAFHLRAKPRGVFDGRFLSAFDAAVPAGGGSDVIQVHVKKDGQFGYRDKSDVADAHEFTALLSFVRTRLGQIADEAMAGRIDIAPYRVGRETPCPRCEFRAVCRFEPGANHYNHLTPLKRTDALDRIAGGPKRGG